MPKNGYWIECVPAATSHTENDDNSRETAAPLYTASMAAVPNIKAIAETPDKAIDRLRNKLRALGRYYRMIGADLPETDNPVRPPRHSMSQQGFISVYIQYREQDNLPSAD